MKDNWLDIQSILPQLQKFVMEELKNISESDYNKYYQHIENHFYTWETKVYPCCNGDIVYSPVAFIIYYKERINGKAKTPLQILREIKKRYLTNCK